MAELPGFRIYLTEHHDGRLTGVLMRWKEYWIDQPPPSGYGRDEAEVQEELEARIHEARATGEDLGRYLWTERFETRRVSLSVHPATMVDTLPVVGHRVTPLRPSFAWSKLESGAFRVMLPRWGWWSLFEDLDDVAPVLEALIGGALHGKDPRWLYEFREQHGERVIPWRPERLIGAADKKKPRDDLGDFPELGRVADEWVTRARRKKLPLVVGEDDISEVITRLVIEGPQPILLVGAPGVGKTAALRKVAARLSKDKRAPRLWSTSAERILAGMVYLGMWQERCLAITEELAEDGDYLYAGRLSSLCRPLGGGGTLAEALEGPITGRDIGFIAECSEAELVHCQRAQPSLVNACRLIHVPEAKADRMLELLQTYQLRTRTRAVLDPQSLGRAVRYLDRYVPGTRFPGKAFAFLDWLRLENANTRARHLDPAATTRAFADYTGLPVELISDSHGATADHIKERLGRGVIGQGHACAVAGRVLARFKAGMNDPGRPLGALFFVGPTGVGKTELAKELARYMFGDPTRMARFDMAEYAHRGAARRLLEVGDGVVSLATRLAAQPLSLVLFDEIEKAHPEVHDLLLGVLDEGRLTDVDGRLIDARMTLFVMTSNLGADAAPPIGFGEDPQDSGDGGAHLGAVRAHFRPEFFGRFDHVVPFRHLTPEDVAQIVDLELKKLRTRRGFTQRRITLRVDPAVRAWLADHGYHSDFGARPLRRLIEEAIVSPVAVAMAQDPSLQDRELVVSLDRGVPRVR